MQPLPIRSQCSGMTPEHGALSPTAAERSARASRIPQARLFPTRSCRAADRQQRDDEHDHGPPRDCERAVVPGEDVPHADSVRLALDVVDD
jgi:hypothetical protein